MIEDLKEFEKLLKLCRKQGVIEFTIGEVNVKLGDAPKKASGEPEDSGEVPTDELTPDQLMFYSSGGVPPP